MFPVNSSLHHGVSLLSTGSHRSGSPPSPILRRRYAILNRIPVAYDFAFRLPRFPPSFRALACALPSDRRRSERARGTSLPATPIPAFSTRTTQDFSGSLPVPPTPMPCSKTPAGSKRPRQIGRSDAAPASNATKAPATHDLVANTRLQHPLSTLHEQRCRCPCKTGFRLAGSPLPGGCRTLWTDSKGFSSTSHPPFQGLS